MNKKNIFKIAVDIAMIALFVTFFNNQNYYCTMFKKFTGKTPLQYRVCNKHS